MTRTLEQVLESFDQLDDAEQTQAAAVILRRTLSRELPPLSDDDLCAAADEIFSQLDQREAQDATR